MKELYLNLVQCIIHKSNSILRYVIPPALFLIGISIQLAFKYQVIGENRVYLLLFILGLIVLTTFLLTVLPVLPRLIAFLRLKMKYKEVGNDVWQDVIARSNPFYVENPDNQVFYNGKNPRVWLIEEEVFVKRKTEEKFQPVNIKIRNQELFDLSLALLDMPEIAKLRGIEITPEKRKELREVMGLLEVLKPKGLDRYIQLRLQDSSILVGTIEVIKTNYEMFRQPQYNLNQESKDYILRHLGQGGKGTDILFCTDAFNTGEYDLDGIVEVDMEGEYVEAKLTDIEPVPDHTVFITKLDQKKAREWYESKFPDFEFELKPESPDTPELQVWVETPSGFNNNAWGDPFCGYPNIVNVTSFDNDVAGHVMTHFLGMISLGQDGPCIWVKPDKWYVLQKNKHVESKSALANAMRWLMMGDSVKKHEINQALKYDIYTMPKEKPIQTIRDSVRLIGVWNCILEDENPSYYISLAVDYGLALLFGAFGANPLVVGLCGLGSAIFFSVKHYLDYDKKRV